MRVVFPLGGTDWGKSGIGTYVRAVLPHLSRQLTAAGHSLIAVGNPRELDAYREALTGIDTALLPSAFDKPGPSAAFYLVAAGVYAKSQGDVLLMPAANRRMPLAAPLPVVAVVHDLAQLHVQKKYDALRMIYLRQVLVPALRRATLLVCVSEATKRDMIGTAHAKADKVRVVLNGVDASRFAPRTSDDPAVKQALGNAGLHEPYILYAARLEHPGKNHVRLLRAYAKSEARGSHRLAFAGGDWGGREVIEREAESLGIRERVRFLGFVSDEDLPCLVSQADAVAMLGLHEGFGLPAMEALGTGRPVFASNTGALPEVVGTLGVLCDPLDEVSIRQALERALTDKELRTRCKNEGPAWARAHGWNRTARGLVLACEEAESMR